MSDASMKVRIGVALGEAGVPSQFGAAVDILEQAGIDSLWLPEMVYGSLVDPFIGMTYALARTSRLKVGTGVAVLPGRHPVLVAKQLASLAGLAPRRVLPVFGLKPARPAELAAFGVPAGCRGAVFDESLELIRRLLREPEVTFRGEFFTVESAHIGPQPAKPLDIWVGGSAPGALRRAGGWPTAGWPASSPRRKRAWAAARSRPPRPRPGARSSRTTSASAWPWPPGPDWTRCAR